MSLEKCTILSMMLPAEDFQILLRVLMYSRSAKPTENCSHT